MDIEKQYYKNRAETLIRNFKKRQIDAEYCETAEEAVAAVLREIPAGSSVSWGGTVTLKETGLHEALSAGSLNILDRDKAGGPGELAEIYHKALSCDYYIMSSNAITMDGCLVNIDGRGNRLAALLYGPEHVIVMAGMNKVAGSEEDALSRVKNTAAPKNALRLDRNTPCTKTGYCSDCQSDDCICCNTVVTRRSITPGRIKVFLVGGNYGF